jgi:protein-S-isoprenylcysteine O-methyltransferase Ste14
MDDLGRQAISGLAKFIIALALFLFVPAWTLQFWQAWLYLLVFAVSTGLITLYLWKRDRALLERRINAGPAAETRKRQRVIQIVASLAFMGTLVVPALDRRFGWSHVPLPAVIAGEILIVAGFAIIFLVFRENTFTAGTVEIAEGQKVISTGPYAYVRHPMYAGALIMLLGTPLALGSSWGLLMFAPMALAIAWRLIDEEQFLAANLAGYAAYRANVGYRLLPFVW